MQREAADWFARRRDGALSAGDEAAFDAWRRRGDAQACAYAGVERDWQAWEALRGSPRMRTLAAEALAATATARGRHGTGRRWRPLLLAAALAAVAAFGLHRLLPLFAPQAPPALVYRTQLGEQRHERLADGTQVTLNTQTELQVRYGDARRDIVLVRGEALFDVAHDPAHPFVVSAAGGTVTALGTRFQVRDDAGAAIVTLLQGRIEVAAADARRTLAPGDQARYAPTGPGIRVHRVDAAAASDWTRGRLDFSGLPLADAIAEANRYSAVKLRLGDPRLADMPVGGSFRVGDNAAIASAFTAVFPLRIAHRDGREIVLMPRE